MKKTIAQGAESIISLDKNIIKERIRKSYRFPELDNKIRKQTTRRETKILEKAYNLIPTPKLISSKDTTIEMEYINGKLIKNILDSSKNKTQLCKQIGNQISLLHKHNIIHGDLTTSNMILKDDKVYFIDYGLSFISHKTEDRAVDLHLLKQALKAKHYKHPNLFTLILKSYNNKEVIERLKKVEQRGRYKQKRIKKN
ncbi:Kae1-associated kinase Bud32 [archaeon]|nr:Kae1-associated kinase Bud32 [archaeon]|tara:strand:- start:2053 stop:2646 length:594 start_codon:yes stop_codon:yes gene_type:complete